MTHVGTLQWADETGGELRVRDRMVLLLGQGVPTQLEEIMGRALTGLGIAKTVDLKGVDVISYVQGKTPRTPIANAAARLCKEISEPWLWAHCQRTFAFGVLLGYKLPFEREHFFLAAMLHDVGLTPAFPQGADPGLDRGFGRQDAPCFAVRGAGVAQSLAGGLGWLPEQADPLAEAISMHLNVRVRRSCGVEAHLLNIASSLDVAGLGLHKLSRETVRSVEDEWPRGDTFPDDLWKAWACEAGIHPKCRGRFLNTWGHFRRRIYRSRRGGSAASS